MRIIVSLALTLSTLVNSSASLEAAPPDVAVQHVGIAPRARESRVPATTAQGRFLAPQAVSAVDVSADGKIITAGTMAFSHDANGWHFASKNGTVTAKRY